MKQAERDFHSFLKAYASYYPIHWGITFVDGGKEGNHVWFVYSKEDQLYKLTTSWFPHIGYVMQDIEVSEVQVKTRKVICYE